MPWSLLLENMLSQEYIDIPWDEVNNTDFYFFKKKHVNKTKPTARTNSQYGATGPLFYFVPLLNKHARLMLSAT